MIDDLRSAFRQIRSHPGFTLAVVVTLALGVGATTAVFTLADPMLFRPLPFPDSDRIVRLRVTGPRGQPVGTIPLADYLRIEERHSGFSATCTYNIHSGGRLDGFQLPPSLLGFEGIVVAYGMTEGCFDTFGLRPALGRAFLPEEYVAADRPAAVAIATDAFWQSALGGRAEAIGQTVRLAGAQPQSFVIVGVMPREFFVPQTIAAPPHLLVPVRQNPARAADARVMDVTARLADDTSIDAAASQLQQIVRDVEREFPAFPQQRQSELLTLRDALFGLVRTPLLLLLGATACVLLLACANLGHLFMSRLHERDREIGMRLAIGAGTWRIARQLISEAAVLALLGAIGALVFARWAFALIMSSTPDFVYVYRLLPAGVDLRVAVFALLLIAVAAVAYGVVPAMFATRRDVRARLQTSGPTTSATGVTDGMLVFAQASIAVALLVTGALIVQSFARLVNQPLGFQPYGLYQVRVELSPALLKDPTRSFTAQRQVYEHLRSQLTVPVAFSSGVPGLNIVDRADRPDADRKVGRVFQFPVADSFFDVFQVQVTRGRLFDERESFSDAPVAVIDERAAATLWPGEDPIGKTLVETGSKPRARTVIGTVREVRMGTDCAPARGGRQCIHAC